MFFHNRATVHIIVITDRTVKTEFRPIQLIFVIKSKTACAYYHRLLLTADSITTTATREAHFRFHQIAAAIRAHIAIYNFIATVRRAIIIAIVFKILPIAIIAYYARFVVIAINGFRATAPTRMNRLFIAAIAQIRCNW